MRIQADTGRGDLDCPDEIRSTTSFCLKATRSEHPTPLSMDNRMGRVTVSGRVRCLPKLAFLALVLSFTVEAATQKVESIPVPGTKAFPESITSTSDGVLFVGRLGGGGVVRVNPRTAESTVFVQPGASGSRSISGVFADEASSTLWACSNDLSALGGFAAGSDTWSALKSFDLKTGDAKHSFALPGSHAFCNDITVDGKGSVYVTDSANPTILKLPAGATSFDVFAQDPAFSAPQGGAGLDGIAFGSDGDLYVTTYTAGELLRVEVKDGRAGRVTKLSGNRHLQFPDALRALGNNSFLLIEGSGRLNRVVIKGDVFAVTPIHDGFVTPTSVAQIGATAWVSEGQLAFFFDLSKRNSSPSLPFRIYAVPLRKEDSK
jgi:sugar lactone lactonase YvrE